MRGVYSAIVLKIEQSLLEPYIGVLNCGIKSSGGK